MCASRLLQLSWRCAVADQCRLERVTVDGEEITVRVRGAEPLDDAGRECLAAIVAALHREFAGEDE